MNMERIEIKSVQDGIVAQLGRAILDGDIPTGAELTQVGLAQELGVSRMPVREALFALEHQGLVTRLPNNHCRVVRPTKVQIARVLDLCRLLEDSVLRALPAGTELPAGEAAFHGALYEACGEGYPRRVLITTTSVYVRYMVERAGAGGELRRAYLDNLRRMAKEGEWDEDELIDLSLYFSTLLDASPFDDEEA